MATNFQFLKKVNNDLFEIISEAEQLYRDEYFEQCMAQTRRFGEQICKDMLEQNNKQTGSFDEMLATLKDHANGHAQEKEFIDDLYFLKKNGNKSVHSGKVKKDAITALECLQRSFEVAINYSVYNQGANTNILKLNYDVELLVTDKKSKKSLKERYEEEKARQQVKEECVVKKTIGQAGLQKRKLQDKQRVTAPNERNEKQKSCVYSSKRDKKQTTRFKISLFWKFVIVLSSISLLGIVFLVVAFSLTH